VEDIVIVFEPPLKISFVFVLVEKAFIFPISLSAWSHNTRLSWDCVSKPASKA
jgi:hypothetical protein